MASTPVHFFSHGSTMMLGEESNSATYWKKCGDAALANGVKHVVMMGAHWATLNDEIEVAANPSPSKSPVAYVHPSKFENYKLNPDLPMVDTCVSLLKKAGLKAKKNASFNWIHDTYLILIRMFPDGCPPTTIISMNARYDPHYHVRVGAALSSLRDATGEGKTLLIGTGGAVHNLYRNEWAQMLLYRDNFAMEKAPEGTLMDFRQEFEDAMLKNSGPALRRAITMLMKMPNYRDAHATDDHFMAACFVAGAAGREEDRGKKAEMGAEDWELRNMCNSQFTLGSWGNPVAV
ncbi:probable aromatic ring-opening dioxygenase family protein [Phialocephala subalpina]|uniref:Probable aromatic ring-opening dioxygenase family protein n=1 Tax=Phialocephala subalpina TaxID=576137 RepID=A0A1L7XA47_9HELO|nr:probable aromatic ring-opening dioxygenase family protein [Phialocephala subalpina]